MVTEVLEIAVWHTLDYDLKLILNLMNIKITLFKPWKIRSVKIEFEWTQLLPISTSEKLPIQLDKDEIFKILDQSKVRHLLLYKLR
jgi:hypothetical protein